MPDTLVGGRDEPFDDGVGRVAFVVANSHLGKNPLHPRRRRVFGYVNREPLWVSCVLAYDRRRRSWIGETVTTYTDGSPSSVQTTDFAYDGNQIVLQFDATSTPGSPVSLTATDLSHRYLNGPAVDQVLADERVTLQNGTLATDEVLWTLADAQGTVRDVAKLNGTTAGVVDHIIYSSFGGVVSESDPSQGCLFKYTGCPTDPATDIEFHFQRPRTTGSVDWLKVDQSSYTSGTTNLGDYCGNDPINATDPSGLASQGTAWNTATVKALLYAMLPKLSAAWDKLTLVGGATQHWTGFNWMFSSSPRLDKPVYVAIGRGMHTDPFFGVHETMLIERLTVHVPDNWTSMEVATFVAEEVAANSDIVAASTNWSLNIFDREMAVLKSAVVGFKQASNEIAEALKAGVETVVSLNPAGAVVVSLHCLSEKRYLAAALAVVAAVRVEHVIEGVNALGFEIQLGGQVVQVPTRAAKVLNTLSKAELKALDAELESVNTTEKLEAILNRLAARPLKLVPIANATRQYRAAEILTAERFMQKTGTTLYESLHQGEEFVDALGNTYDACGSLLASQRGNMTEFCDSILEHVQKSCNYTVLDLTGFTAEQIAAIKTYIADTLTAAQQAKILKIGF